VLPPYQCLYKDRILAAQVFRLNSLFDPDLSGTGHQPLYYDQLTTVYGQYCVTAVSVFVQGQNSQSATAIRVVFAISDQNVSTETVPNLIESAYSRNTVLAETTAGPAVRSIKIPPTSMAMIQGGEDIRDDPNNYTVVTTNPIDPVFGILKIDALDGITTAAAALQVTIAFDCTFKEKSVPTPSLVERVQKYAQLESDYRKEKERLIKGQPTKLSGKTSASQLTKFHGKWRAKERQEGVEDEEENEETCIADYTGKMATERLPKIGVRK